MTYYSIEAEQAVLGEIIHTPDLIYETVLTPDDFYHGENKAIFEAMVSLRDEEKIVDLVSLTSKIGNQMQDIGGAQYLLQLRQNTLTVANFAYHEQIVRDKSLIRTGLTGLKEIYHSDKDSPLQLSAEIMDIAEKIADRARTKDGFIHIRNGLMDHSEQLQLKLSSTGSVGVSTPGKALDKIIGKWQKQSLNIIAARPSVGKTQFLLNNARIVAHEGLTTAIFSLEQPGSQMYDRMVCAESMIDGERMRTGRLTDDEWIKYTMGVARLTDLNVFMDDRPGLTVQEIRAAVRKLKKKYPDIVVFIDYLQLIQAGKKMDNRTQEVGYVSGSLKQMARENDCPVIALAQLSRSVEQRADKRPMMSDLRESGNIEQDADTITFLYRDDYYNQETEKKNIIECIVAKNRNGSVGTAEMINLKNYGKFVDIAA